MSRKIFLSSICASVSASASCTALAFISQCVSLSASVVILCYRSRQPRTTTLASIFLSVTFRLVPWPLYCLALCHFYHVSQKSDYCLGLNICNVYSNVSASTLGSVSPRAESGVSTFTLPSVSPCVSAFISATVSATESKSASVIKSASVLLIVCISFSGSVSVCQQHSWPVLRKTCKP